MADPAELLFFDTFAHENSEELNLDLVQFPKPVYVTEVRIIPLGARVQADFPGGVRLGATNPSQFAIEFFVNDLGKPGASTFETLGGFDYNQNDCIHLECVPTESNLRQIPTDGLVLRGWYTTITLAVYGTLTKNITEQIIQPVVAPNLPQQTAIVSEVQSIISVNPIETEWQQEPLPPVPMEYNAQPSNYVQSYTQQEPYPQEYPVEYYNNSEGPKDPRSYHHTPENDWDIKTRSRSTEKDRSRDPVDRSHDRNDRSRSDRDRHYSRSHSRDRDRRDYRENSRDRDRDRDWERDRSYKHQDYKRLRGDTSYSRNDERDRDELRTKRPRTPPIVPSPKRPHTPQGDSKDLSPGDVESISEEEMGDGNKHMSASKADKTADDKPKTKSPVPLKAELATEEAPPIVDDEEFEPILSDEEICDDTEHFQDGAGDYDYAAYSNNDDIIKLYVPGQTEVHCYEPEPNFTVTECKSGKRISVADRFKTEIASCYDYLQSQSTATEYKFDGFEALLADVKEEFVNICEATPATLTNTKCYDDIAKLYNVLATGDAVKDADEPVFVQAKRIIECLFEWLRISLDFDKAISQEQPGYKIRHIKCGVRLSEWCCSIGANFVDYLSQKDYHVFDRLLELYHQEYMALSIKLLILHALDAYLSYKSTIELFLTNQTLHKENGFTEEDAGDVAPNVNGYKTLIYVTRSTTSARLKFSLNSLLKKLNVYDALRQFRETVVAVYKRNANNVNAAAEIPENVLTPQEASLIVSTLEQILAIQLNGAFALSQPKRFLPVAVQFEINRSDVRSAYYALFTMHNLLECCVFLLTLPVGASVSGLLFDFLSEMAQNAEGIDVLAENAEVCNLLIKCLLQTDEEMQFALPPDSIEMKSHNLGLSIALKMQCLYHIRFLSNIGAKKNFDCGNGDVIDQLHALYCLTFTNNGRLACAELLTLSDNVQCLLQFLNFAAAKEKSEGELSKLKKCPGIGYIIDLLHVAVTLVPNVAFMDKYAKRILVLSQQHELYETATAAKLQEITNYLKPFESTTNLSFDDISTLMEIVKKNLENVQTCHPQLITALWTLKYMGISSDKAVDPLISENIVGNYLELKYKHVILQLFSLDGISTLTAVLQKLCEYYEQPSLHTMTFASLQSAQIINVVLPAVQLLKQMLTYVIQCRNTLFKDLTSLPVLLQTYNLMYSFPLSSIAYKSAQKVCKEIVDTLLVYTQPINEEITENDSLNKTLWTLMAGEVVKYILTAPYTFMPGLLTFSELLPLPLPTETRVPLTDTEISWAVNLRKLWSAHLHPHGTAIQELINRLCVSTCQPLLHLLRRVCIQLSDLAANTAIMITRGILDSVYASLVPKSEENTLCNGNTARILHFLACLVSHGAIKCAVLQLLRPAAVGAHVKGDEKYQSLVQAFGHVLRTRSSSPAHIQAQECVISIIQCLCDSEITLLQSPDGTVKSELTSEVYLANSIPIKDILLPFVNSLLDHLSVDNQYTTCLLAGRTLLLLTEHDYGFCHLRECLNRRQGAFEFIFKKFVNNFSKDSADCLSTLSTMLELVRLCLTDDVEVEGPLLFVPRTATMSADEVKALINWKKTTAQQQDDEIESKHCLIVLESMLKEIVVEDASFSGLLDTLLNVLKLLCVKQEESQAAEGNANGTEVVLPQPESLLGQFTARPVYTLTEVSDDRLTSSYWLSTPADEGEPAEMISCDLAEICRVHLPPETNLTREIEKLCRINPAENAEQAKIKKIDSQKDKLKRPFVTPMRGRGFPRTVPQRGDLFRSRPPNTSRPPSLHVDDFVALETCGAQPTGPTGYNKLSRDIMSTRAVRGTRGRSFVTSDRGSHYRQLNRTLPAWPGAHVNDSLEGHFRTATAEPDHFGGLQMRGRGGARLREMPQLRHVRTFPR